MTQDQKLFLKLWIFPQIVKMPRISSADATMLAVHDLIEVSQNPVPAAPFSTFNDTHQTKLRSLAGIFNIIPKDTQKKSKDRYNVNSSGTQEAVTGPMQGSAPTTHHYPTRQLQHHTKFPRVQVTKEKGNPGTPPRVAPRVVPLITKEEINNMTQPIPNTTHSINQYYGT